MRVLSTRAVPIISNAIFFYMIPYASPFQFASCFGSVGLLPSNLQYNTNK